MKAFLPPSRSLSTLRPYLFEFLGLTVYESNPSSRSLPVLLLFGYRKQTGTRLGKKYILALFLLFQGGEICRNETTTDDARTSFFFFFTCFFFSWLHFIDNGYHDDDKRKRRALTSTDVPFLNGPLFFAGWTFHFLSVVGYIYVRWKKKKKTKNWRRRKTLSSFQMAPWGAFRWAPGPAPAGQLLFFQLIFFGCSYYKYIFFLLHILMTLFFFFFPSISWGLLS